MNNTKDAMYCRLCAELKKLNRLINLQIDEEMCQNVVNKLSRFNIVMDFQDNILPKTVCLICVKSLERAFTFVTAVEQAQAFLCDFILVQINTAASVSSAENMLYEPPDNENCIDGCKDEHSGDSLEINDDGINLSEERDSEVMSNDFDYSVINGNTEEYNIIENKHYIQPSNEIIEENINVKDKCVELPDLFHDEDDNNILKEKELNSEGILLDSTVCSADYINKQNDSNENMYEPPDNENGIVGCKDQHSQDSMEVNDDGILSENISLLGAGNMDKELQQLQPQHKENNSKQIPPKQLTTTAHSKTNINKILKTKKIKHNNSKPSAKNTETDVEHVKITWKDYEWKCYYCETLFPSIDELRQHSMQFHNSCNPYQCTDCVTRRSVLKKFLKHVSKHKNYLRYSCYRCFKKFPKIYQAGHHLKQVHADSDYVCSGCNTPFYTNRELKVHVEKYYKQLFRKPPFDLTCTICNKHNETAKDLRKHLLTHKNKKEYICETCGKCFAFKAELGRHMVVHGTLKILHHCDICNATFSRVSRLQCHKSIHTGIKPFICDNCGKCFRTKPLITSHMRTHMDSLLHPCTQCNKKFPTAFNLKQHMFQHTGEKPFSCNICPKDFTNLSNRNKHMRRIHDIELGRKKQPIIKQQSVNDRTSSDLATGEPKFADLDKMNKCKNKIMEHRKTQRANNKNKKEKVIRKEGNEN